jgi:Flp pilus assembly protein TadD
MEVVRLTLLRSPLTAACRDRALPLALTVSLLWMAHPLQTQCVTYIYQRYESLMGLFVLMSVYCFVRAVDSSRPRWWYGASIACWLLGLGSKETALVVPAVVLWYDRALVASSWRELVARRWAYYGAMAGVIIAGAAAIWARRAWYSGGGVLAFDRVSPWEYARSQPGVVLHYLRLSFWPQGQCVDYCWPVAVTFAETVGPLVPLALLLGLTVWCSFRRPAWGFLGGWFFLTLLPTSSFAPIIDLAFEHRMYLPLAGVAAAAVLGVHGLLQRLDRSRSTPIVLRRSVGIGLVVPVVIALGAMTFVRNEVYRDEVVFWEDVVRKSPRNVRGRVALASALILAHRPADAAKQAYLAVQLAPGNAKAHNDLGLALGKLGQTDRALAAYREAIRLDPKIPEPYGNLGNALRKSDPEAAIVNYRKALALQPHDVAARINLGNLLRKTSPAEAEEHYRAALGFDPSCAEAHNNLGNLLRQQGRLDEAMTHIRTALRLKPDYQDAQRNLRILEKVMNR